jgi:hypothetical protein
MTRLIKMTCKLVHHAFKVILGLGFKLEPSCVISSLVCLGQRNQGMFQKLRRIIINNKIIINRDPRLVKFKNYKIRLIR